MSDMNTPNLIESADWKSMEDFSAGIDTNRLPQTDALEGREVAITLADGGAAVFTFEPNRTVRWNVNNEPWAGSGEDTYDGVAVGDGAFWVDLNLSDRPVESITAVFQPETGWALLVHSVIHDENFDSETRVTQSFHAGYVGDKRSITLPAPTRDLIGKRTLFRYSPNHLYEHIYLSSRRFVWHNLVGEQRGHAAAELATTWKLEDGLYVFTWREEIIPVGTVFVFDYARGRSTGKFIGLSGSGEIQNDRGGAEIIEFGYSNYGEHQEPV